MKIWIGEIPDVFGGYGISAASTTREGAKKTLETEWRKRMPHSSFPQTDTFDEHFERFGGHLAEIELEKAYHQGFRE